MPNLKLLYPKARAINVLAWAGMFDLQYVAQFERKTGIRVNVSYYESNEELMVKMRATKGKGYDLIIPSDYAVHMLYKEGLLKKLDKVKMPFYARLNPLLLGHYFDPENNYSVPYEWAVFGLGIDTTFFGARQPEATWGLVFDPAKIPAKIVMSNDPFVAIPLAAFYLFGSQRINSDQLHAIEKLLMQQKPYVEAYTDFRADYYIATKNCPIAVASSSYIWRSMALYAHIDFIIPKEGTLVTIESCAIPEASTKEDLVYEFLAFMYDPQTVIHNFEALGLFPATRDVIEQVTLEPRARALLAITPQEFKRFHFLRLDLFKPPITEQVLQDTWVTVKS